ncbi:DUF1254 domain-containing protein [Archangium violaceum]|uniref:DUF1254 domain-containing protein n=1 Tax=Archangium violaceum TaxID=83451 RepID=UPI000696C358|nr:DUF1254 domain-containing protein [Archangium violaceum]
MTALTPDEASDLAYQAFMYGYPMVDNYRVLWESIISTGQQFNTLYGNARLYGPEDTTIVTPNNDTAYSQGWLDLGTEPIVLQVPNVPQDPPRYYSFQIIDAFTNNVRYIGSLTTGTQAGNYVLAGPDSTPGEVPGATVFHMPGRYIFLIGRTQVFDKADLPAVQALMDQYKLVPLSTFLQQTPPAAVPPPTFLPIQSSFIETLAFFEYLNLTLSFQTPPAGDEPLLERFKRIGVGDGMTFDPTQLEPEIAGALQQGLLRANTAINAMTTQGATKNGWVLPVVDREYFGTNWWPDYEFRSMVARSGIYANSPSEAIYYRGYTDAASKDLDGGLAYTLTFQASEIPQAQAFWSLTMYGANQLLVPNPIGRYSLGSDSKLTTAADGSVTLYIQGDAPKDTALLANWLPSPKEGSFYVVLRIYGPENKGYVPPGIVVAGAAQ